LSQHFHCVQEINEGTIFEDESYLIRTCTAQHRVSAFSYLFEEKLANGYNKRKERKEMSG